MHNSFHHFQKRTPGALPDYKELSRLLDTSRKSFRLYVLVSTKISNMVPLLLETHAILLRTRTPNQNDTDRHDKILLFPTTARLRTEKRTREIYIILKPEPARLLFFPNRIFTAPSFAAAATWDQFVCHFLYPHQEPTKSHNR